VRRELPHPGLALDAFEIRDGYRYQVFTTNMPSGQLAFLRSPVPGARPVEDRIRTGKDTGIGYLPSRHNHINQVWLELALIAADLLALSQSMLLTDQPVLHRAEPTTPRYRLLHVTDRITVVNARCSCAWPNTGPGRSPWPKRSLACGRSRFLPDSQYHRHAPLIRRSRRHRTRAGSRRCAHPRRPTFKIVREGSIALLNGRG